MKLYLVRHAIAEDRPPDHGDDSLRPLTEKGREKMTRIASGLGQLGVTPDLIVCSPYVRARQTASILAKVLKYEEKLVYSNSLMPLSEPDDMIGEINEKYSVGELMLVGHEPNLSMLASVLLAGNPDLPINFKKGGICCLSVNDLLGDRKAELEWLVTPKISTKLS